MCCACTCTCRGCSIAQHDLRSVPDTDIVGLVYAARGLHPRPVRVQELVRPMELQGHKALANVRRVRRGDLKYLLTPMLRLLSIQRFAALKPERLGRLALVEHRPAPVRLVVHKGALPLAVLVEVVFILFPIFLTAHMDPADSPVF